MQEERIATNQGDTILEEHLLTPCKLLKVVQLPLLPDYKQEIVHYPMLLFVNSFMRRWESPTVVVL